MCNLNEIEYSMLVKFLDKYRTKGKSENTIQSYSIDLIQFHEYIRKCKNIIEFTPEVYDNITFLDADSFIDYLNKQIINGKQGLSNSTKSRKQSSLKMFFKYLKKAGVVRVNVTNDFEPIKIEDRLPVYLEDNEIKKLLDSVNRDVENPFYERDVCIITMFLMTGLRASELCNVKIDKINRNMLTVIGKGNKERQIPLVPVVIKAYKQYMKDRSKGKIKDEEYLFLSKNGNKLDRNAVNNIVKKHCTNAKVNKVKNVTCHSLRHSLGSLLANQGQDTRVIQEILGHSSISTTQIYTHLSNKKVKDSMNKNPFANYELNKIDEDDEEISTEEE